MTNKPIADIHCHPTVIPYIRNKSIWFYKPPTRCQRRKGRYIWDNIARPYTQSDFVSLYKGGVRVVFASLYPIEWCFMTVTRKPVLDKGFFRAIWEIIVCIFRWIIQILGMYTFVGRIISTYPARRIREILKYDREYFDELCEEYKMLSGDAVIPKKIAKKKKVSIPEGTRINIVGDYTEIEKNLKSVNIISVILSAEGAQVLGSGQKNTLDGLPDSELNDLNNPRTKALFEKLKTNISKLKKWGPSGEEGTHTPFFIDFNHHFWNQLSGHAMSQADGGHVMFDQRRGLNTPFNELGKKIVRELLVSANGRRILLGSKHMSIDTRKWYYERIAAHNKGKSDEKKLPVIASHVATNGIGTMDASRNTNDPNEMDKRYDESDSLFNIWDINLTREEILEVQRSNGIIGLILDQRVLGGKMVNDFLNKMPCKVKNNKELFRWLWAKPVLDNLLYVARIVKEGGDLKGGKTIWDNICLGVDFDGRINPIDSYCTAEDLPVLKDVLIKRMEDLQKKGSEPLLEAEDVVKIADAIFFTNVQRFLKTYFNPAYLNDPLEVEKYF